MLDKGDSDRRTELLGGILLFDASNSGPDGDMDRLMYDIIRREFPRFTVIWVPQRLETIHDYDMVLVKAGGKLQRASSYMRCCRTRTDSSVVFRRLGDMNPRLPTTRHGEGWILRENGSS
jgi:hypothetical protein